MSFIDDLEAELDGIDTSGSWDPFNNLCDTIGNVANSLSTPTKSSEGNRTLSLSDNTSTPIKASESKPSFIYMDGLHHYLVLKSGKEIQLYDFYAAYGTATDYNGNKYSGLGKLPIVKKE